MIDLVVIAYVRAYIIPGTSSGWRSPPFVNNLSC